MRLAPRFRRLVAVLLGALLLPASLRAAPAGCAVVAGATRVSAPAVVPAAGVTGEHRHHGAVPATGATRDADVGRPDAPSRGDASHCAIAMSCVQLGLAPAASTIAIVLRGTAAPVMAVNDARPESAGAAPEPPPPRA